jgi:hypothetical protein
MKECLHLSLDSFDFFCIVYIFFKNSKRENDDDKESTKKKISESFVYVMILDIHVDVRYYLKNN